MTRSTGSSLDPSWASDHPHLRGAFRPIAAEVSIEQLEVSGVVPDDLAGCLARIGANPQFAPRDDNHHWFIGGGMLHLFEFADGRVGYRNRWVRTPKWEAEQAAGTALMGSWGNPATSDPRAGGVPPGSANTNIIRHDDRVFALSELSPPFELDRKTFESISFQDFGGRIDTRFTAHPKTDPRTGELVFFGHSVAGLDQPVVAAGAIDAGGTVTTCERMTVPYPSLIHDFAITANHVLLPVLPLVCDPQLVASGRPPYCWQPELGAHIGVFERRNGAQDIRWYTGEACYAFHTVNAWQDAASITCLVMQFDVAPLFPDRDGSWTDADRATGRLCRWTIDLSASGTEFEQEYLDDVAGEFPRIDDRLLGERCRYVYFASHRNADEPTFSLNGITRFDLDAASRASWRANPGDVVSEPVFVPRSSTAPEGDGYVLATCFRRADDRSDLLVFDAGTIEDGPIMSARLPHRVPAGFHGNWLQP